MHEDVRDFDGICLDFYVVQWACYLQKYQKYNELPMLSLIAH